MIARIWRGRTTMENAAAYQQVVLKEVAPGIAARQIRGLHGSLQLLRRDVSSAEVEFMTIMLFDDLGAVQEFAGDAIENSVLPKPARSLLSTFDKSSTHFTVVA